MDFERILICVDHCLGSNVFGMDQCNMIVDCLWSGHENLVGGGIVVVGIFFCFVGVRCGGKRGTNLELQFLGGWRDSGDVWGSVDYDWGWWAEPGVWTVQYCMKEQAKEYCTVLTMVKRERERREGAGDVCDDVRSLRCYCTVH